MQSEIISAIRQRRLAMSWLALVTVAAHLPVLLVSSGGLDTMSALSLAAAGQTPLFPPLWGMIATPLAWAAQVSGMNEAFWFRLPNVAASLGLSLLLYRMLARLAPEAPLAPKEKAPPFWTSRAFWLSMAWAAHPLAALVNAGQGAADVVALFAVGLAAWYVEFSDHPRSDRFGALALSAAVALEAWPLALLPVFLKAFATRRERLEFAAWSLAFPLLACLPVLWQDYSFAAPTSPLGLGAALVDLVSLRPQANPWFVLVGPGLTAAAALVYLAGPWRFPLLPGLALSGLIMFVVTPVAPVQALLWPLPFVLAVPGSLPLRLSLAALGMALLHFGISDPGAMFLRRSFLPPSVPDWFRAAWGLLNAMFWGFLIWEAWKLLKSCLRPARLGFR